MKKNIHPKLYKIKVKCSCKKKIYNIYSTIDKELNLDTCSNCHNYYKKKNNNIIKEGRLSSFNKKFNF